MAPPGQASKADHPFVCVQRKSGDCERRRPARAMRGASKGAVGHVGKVGIVKQRASGDQFGIDRVGVFGSRSGTSEACDPIIRRYARVAFWGAMLRSSSKH